MGWTAEIMVSDAGAGFKHLYATTEGDSKADALEGAQAIFDAFAAGKEAFIRTMPEAFSDTDFDTKITSHKGFVRFSFGPHAGSHHFPVNDVQKIFGFGQVA